MNDENIVKKVCDKFDLSLEELAECLGVKINILKNIEVRADWRLYLENVFKNSKKPPCKKN